MPETIEVESFRELPADVEVGTVVVRKTNGGGESALRRSEHARGWRSVVIETISLAGRGPYQDTVDTYEVTFSGGTPSSAHGWELPFATFPPRSRHLDANTVWSSSTPEEKDRRHAQYVRDRVRGLLDYEVDAVGGVEAMRMGAIYLREFALVSRDHFSTTYRAVVVKPNMS